MAKPVGGINKYPFGETGISPTAINTGTAVNKDLYIHKQCSTIQYQINSKASGTKARDRIAVSGDATETATINITVGTSSFSVEILTGTSATSAAQTISTAARNAGFVSSRTSSSVTIEHKELGPAEVLSISGTVTGLTFAPSNVTPGVAPAGSATQRSWNTIGKQRFLFTIVSSGLKPSDTAFALAGNLEPGEMTIKVFNADGDAVGFVHEFQENLLSVNILDVGQDTTANLYDVDEYMLVTANADGKPVIPSGTKFKFFVLSKTQGKA